MNNSLKATASNASAINRADEPNERAVEVGAHPTKPELFAQAVNLATAAPSPAFRADTVRLDAVRVLSLALISALEREGDNDVRRGPSINLRDEVQHFEANLIRSALAYTGGRQRQAARLLGVNVSTLNARIKRYKLNSEQTETH